MADIAGPGAGLAVALEVVEDLEHTIWGAGGTLCAHAEATLGPRGKGVVQVGVQVRCCHAFAGC